MVDNCLLQKIDWLPAIFNLSVHQKPMLNTLTIPRTHTVHLHKIRSAKLCFFTVCATRVIKTVYYFGKQFPTLVYTNVYHSRGFYHKLLSINFENFIFPLIRSRRPQFFLVAHGWKQSIKSFDAEKSFALPCSLCFFRVVDASMHAPSRIMVAPSTPSTLACASVTNWHIPGRYVPSNLVQIELSDILQSYA